MRVAHVDDAKQLNEVVRGLLGARVAVVFFSHHLDPKDLARRLSGELPGTKLIGCSTAGEISTGRCTKGGVSSAGLDEDIVGCCGTAMVRYELGVPQAVEAAAQTLEAQLRRPLRELDPKRHIGLAFHDAVSGKEEEVLTELGARAPFLTFLGGTAGDDIAFKQTHHIVDAEGASAGSALMVLELLRPFSSVKIHNFEPSGRSFVITRAEGRRIHELDGKPAAFTYAEAIGVPLEQLSPQTTFASPLGVMINGEPWVRQPGPPFHQDGALITSCQMVTGNEAHILKPKGNLVNDLRRLVADQREQLGHLRGALMFDCALRMAALSRSGELDDYFAEVNFPACGFCTQGETFIGHMHQTLTALFIG